MAIDFNFKFPQDLINQINRMGMLDEIAPKMLDEATPIIERNVKLQLARHRRTGDMIASVKRTKAKKTKNGGYYAVVRPTGKDNKGVRNMEKIAHMEYGTAKQPSTPVLTKALHDSEKEVAEKMQNVFDREVADKDKWKERSGQWMATDDRWL